MAAAERGPFARGVRELLADWPALKFAVANGFGGPLGAEKADWLGGALLEFFALNEELEEEEVEEFLAEVLDNEFDTLVEDGSLQQVSRQLVRLYARTSQLDAQRVGVATESPAHPPQDPAHPWTSPAHRPPSSAPTPPPHPGREEEEEEEEEAMECGTPPSDGWTLVQRRRR